MTDKPWPFEPVVRDIVAQLAAGYYAELERQTGGVRLSASELAGVVREYGRRIIPSPERGELLLDVVPLAAGGPSAWSVDVPLWTAEEGRSDLTLQLTVRARSAGGFDVEIDDLHVL